MGLPIWARWIRVRGATKDVAGDARRAGDRRRREIRPGDRVVLDADGAAVVARRARRARCSRRRSRARRRSASSARSSQAGALSYDLDGLRARVEGRVTRPRPHPPRRAAHARAATRACASSSTCSGWRSRRATGQSVYLRGWGDYQRYSRSS